MSATDIKLTTAMQRLVDTGKIINYYTGNTHMTDNGFMFMLNFLGDKYYWNPETNQWAKLGWINQNAWQMHLCEDTPTF